MATIDSLAPETLSDFDFLVASNPSSTAQASLVFRGWRDPAQRALFAFAVLTPNTSAAWLRSEARARYRPRRNVLNRNGDGLDVSHTRPADVLRAAVGVEHLAVKPGEQFEGDWRVLASPALAGKHRSHASATSEPLEGNEIAVVFAPLVPFFSLIVPNLRHLAFPAFPPLTSLNPLLRTCTSLEPIKITFSTYSDFTSSTTMILAPLRLTIDALPPSTSRLSFDVVATPFPDDKASFALHVLSSPSTANVQRVDVLGCTGGDLRETNEADEFFAECERREILVVCDGELA